jgi:hypothetical protein
MVGINWESTAEPYFDLQTLIWILEIVDVIGE